MKVIGIEVSTISGRQELEQESAAYEQVIVRTLVSLGKSASEIADKVREYRIREAKYIGTST